MLRETLRLSFLASLAGSLILLTPFVFFPNPALGANETGGGSSGRGGDSQSTAWQFAYELNEVPSKPIIAPFKKLFPKCMDQVAGKQGFSQCQFQNLGIAPSAEHCRKSPGSCHNVGKAIDVGKVRCGHDFVKDPRKDHEFYNQLSKCFLTDPELGGKGKFQTVIYAHPEKKIMEEVKAKGASFIMKEDHADHIHIQWDCVTNAPENYKACGQQPPADGSSGSGTSGGSSGGGSSGGGMPSMPPMGGGMPSGGGAPNSAAPANPPPANAAPANPAPANPAQANPTTAAGVPTNDARTNATSAAGAAVNDSTVVGEGATNSVTPPKSPATVKTKNPKAPAAMAPPKRMRDNQ